MSGIGFLRHKGSWNILLNELTQKCISSDECIPSPNSIIPMKLHLCSAPVRLYCRHKNTYNLYNFFSTQHVKSISDFKTSAVEFYQLLHSKHEADILCLYYHIDAGNVSNGSYT